MKSRYETVLEIIDRALKEDLADSGDATSLSIFSDDNKMVTARIGAKESGVLSGVSLIEPIFYTLSNQVTVKLNKCDGEKVIHGDLIATVEGPIIAVLSGERLALNLLQRLSGIATATAELVEQIKETDAKLLDTRKTTPNLRMLEKEAVIHGGGVNHRFGLYDMIMAKDTHVKAAGGPDKAVERAKEWNIKEGRHLKIEVEVESLEQFDLALTSKPDRIMLDNMSNEDMTTAVEKRNSVDSNIELEASGNVTKERIKSIAETGVDFISVGGITHSVKALDIHLILI